MSFDGRSTLTGSWSSFTSAVIFDCLLVHIDLCVRACVCVRVRFIEAMLAESRCRSAQHTVINDKSRGEKKPLYSVVQWRCRLIMTATKHEKSTDKFRDSRSVRGTLDYSRRSNRGDLWPVGLRVVEFTFSNQMSNIDT
jgi:hypothetical protein